MIVYLQMIETNEDKSKFEGIYQEYRNLLLRNASITTYVIARFSALVISLSAIITFHLSLAAIGANFLIDFDFQLNPFFLQI